ncbi:hypothetical protein V6N11_007830 [Hibiscus sabdariffa]|uniref:RNase H type-1 domain-containing protein n=1 Tax=Hibiscus sabdariffa TaxID=183260 RepID=A0ABR2PZ14_9ROSI
MCQGVAALLDIYGYVILYIVFEVFAVDCVGSRWVCLNVDGVVSPPSCDGRIGELIRNDGGDWIMGFAKAIDHSNSLQAKLWALFEGMKFAWEHDFEMLLVQSDCRHAVELVNSPSVGSLALSMVHAIDRLQQGS